MKLLFSTKEKIILAAITVILILYLALLQFYFLSPLKSDLQSKQQSLQSEQKLLAAMQKNAKNNESGDENTTELQEEIPVKPLEDQFILDLQKAEAVSNSQIKSMSFADGGQAQAASTQAAAATNTTQQQTNTGTSQTNTSGTSSQQQTAQSTSGSSGQQAAQSTSGTAQQNTQNTTTTQASAGSLVNKLTVQLSIVSPHYEDLEKFINTLEGLKRITVVESINYTGNKEITSLDQNNVPMAYTLTVSSYYVPSLTDLQKQLPKADFPAPANKDNPLSQFANTESDKP